MRRRIVCALLWGAVGCGGADHRGADVRTWGTMREVLREGRSEGRVTLAEVVNPGAVGVGALEGLAGEVTVIDGAIHLAAVSGGRGVRVEPTGEERASLLVLADVGEWTSRALPAIESLDALEEAVRDAASAAGLDPSSVVPFRVEGRFAGIDLHVIAGACPIANPDGPPPWRWSGEGAEGVLVGFYAANRVGELTHHGRRSHTHALVRIPGGPHLGSEVSGHLDSIRLPAGSLLHVGS